ncbi:MAG: hypothetical protein A2Z88_02150 [Omnitrophica WOR_2 bacterium GWA2_47_8]|nr:MAG: hypothetical protein A2Z88_02150 [Omnitrophica WOR_2 bacterium GWA2_47_8]
MTDIAKNLIFIGIAITIAGIVMLFAGKIPWLGRLPGDIIIKRENLTFYFPLATCILLSLLLTFIFSLFNRR